MLVAEMVWGRCISVRLCKLRRALSVLQQAHSCFTKAAMVAGIQHVRLLPANRASDYAVQPQQLEQAVAADLSKGLIPFYFMASIGEGCVLYALVNLACTACDLYLTTGSSRAPCPAG